MNELVLLDESYASVRADPAVPCIVVQLHSFANRSQFQHLMNTGLAYYKEHSRPAQRWGWVADTRNMSAIPQEVQQWLATEWNQQAYQAGLREMSIVTSNNIMGKLATQEYAARAEAQTEKYILEPHYYASVEEAKRSVARQCFVLNRQR